MTNLRRALVLLPLLAACGGEEPVVAAPMPVTISGLSRLSGVVSLEARVFGEATSCERVLANANDVRAAEVADSGCDPDSQALCMFGEYQIDIGQGRGRITNVRVGVRTLSIVAIGSANEPVGQGCADGLEVTEKVATPIEITLSPI